MARVLGIEGDYVPPELRTALVDGCASRRGHRAPGALPLVGERRLQECGDADRGARARAARRHLLAQLVLGRQHGALSQRRGRAAAERPRRRRRASPRWSRPSRPRWPRPSCRSAGARRAALERRLGRLAVWLRLAGLLRRAVLAQETGRRASTPWTACTPNTTSCARRAAASPAVSHALPRRDGKGASLDEALEHEAPPARRRCGASASTPIQPRPHPRRRGPCSASTRSPPSATRRAPTGRRCAWRPPIDVACNVLRKVDTSSRSVWQYASGCVARRRAGARRVLQRRARLCALHRQQRRVPST